MRTEIVGINHLKEAMALVNRAHNLLNQGKNVLPFCIWQDLLENIKDEMHDYIELESSSDLGTDEE